MQTLKYIFLVNLFCFFWLWLCFFPSFQSGSLQFGSQDLKTLPRTSDKQQTRWFCLLETFHGTFLILRIALDSILDIIDINFRLKKSPQEGQVAWSPNTPKQPRASAKSPSPIAWPPDRSSESIWYLLTYVILPGLAQTPRTGGSSFAHLSKSLRFLIWVKTYLVPFGDDWILFLTRSHYAPTSNTH